MSYDSRALELLTNQLLSGKIKKEKLEEKISQAKCDGDDYIIDSQLTAKVRTENYRIENQGDRLAVIKNNRKVVAVLEYHFDSFGILYLPWGKSYEKGKGHMSSLFSEAKKLAEINGVEGILCEIDETNEEMQEIAYHWGFEKGGQVPNSNNTDSFYYFYEL